MQNGDWPIQCQSCRKFETCKEFGEPPVGDACPNYWGKESELKGETNANNSEDQRERVDSETVVEGIHMDGYDPRMIDVEYYSRLRWLSNLCLFAGIWTMISCIASLLGNYGNVWDNVLNTISGIYFLVLCIYTFIAIRKRKPNAVFYARFIMAVCLLSWIVLIATGGFELTGSNIIFGLGTLIYGGLGLYWSFTDNEVKEVFPKDYRKTTWKDYLFCFGYILIPLIVVGVILLSALGIGYAKAPNHLKEAVEYANSQCPINQGYGIVTSIKYENNTCTYYYLIDESVVDMNTVEQNKDKFALLTIKRSATQADGVQFLDEIVKAKASCKIEFMGNQTGRSVSSICDTRTIKACLREGGDNNDFEFLETTIEMQKLLLPIKIDENTLFSDIYLKHENLQYVYDLTDVEEEDLDWDYLKECALLELGISSVQQANPLLPKLINLGYGWQYNFRLGVKYIGAYVISSTEIEKALTHPLTETEYIKKYLEATVANVNRKDLPLVVDQGLTIESLEVNDDYLIYNYGVDEKLVRLDVIKENKKELKSALLEYDLETTVGILAAASEKGISYHFNGNRSKKTVVFDCPYKEIEPLIKY